MTLLCIFKKLLFHTTTAAESLVAAVAGALRAAAPCRGMMRTSAVVK
jgi:hypothetical protein